MGFGHPCANGEAVAAWGFFGAAFARVISFRRDERVCGLCTPSRKIPLIVGAQAKGLSVSHRGDEVAHAIL